MDSGKVREQGQSLNQIFRENLKYILAVLFVWAITFPSILQNKDNILATINLWYNNLSGYPNPRIAHQLAHKGDEILQGRQERSGGFFSNLTSLVSSDDSGKSMGLPLDLQIMEKSCLYYRSKEHIEEIFLEPTWLQKSQTWNSRLFRNAKPVPTDEVSLGPNPKEYWNSHIEAVLEALDYYKRALRFSGPEFIVPKKIESVAWAVCRPAEILLAYKTHMLETEKYVFDKLDKENKLPTNLKNASELQKLTVILSSIKIGSFPEVNQNDYLESLLRQILLTGMKNFSPREMDSVFERILFFVGHDDKEYLKFMLRRGDLFFLLGKEEPVYFKKAISQYQVSANIKLAESDETVDLPILLVHQFESTLAITKCYHELGDDKKSLTILDSLIPRLRNVDQRSVGGVKVQILNDYIQTKVAVLRKLKRYEEADEILQSE